MDSSSVLLALEEQTKWRERRRRIRERIRQLDRRKAALTKELDRVHKKMSEWSNGVLADLKGSALDRTSPPIMPGR